VAWAARAHGVPCRIVVPHGNSREKNAAMRALGAELIEHGEDFQAALEHARELAGQLQAHTVPSYHRDLVVGVATYWWELLRAAPQVTHICVPIGMGSGACAAIAAKLALGHQARVIGVTSTLAPTYPRSLAAGHVVAAEVSTQLADGLAVRQADPQALRVLQAHLHDLVQVSDEEVAHAMRLLFQATHNVAEGAGAASLAGALQQAESLRREGAVLGLSLTGGNVDAETFAGVLQGA
jgi:threonine dehydratase